MSPAEVSRRTDIVDGFYAVCRIDRVSQVVTTSACPDVLAHTVETF